MLILGIDTATPQVGAAIGGHEGLLGSFQAAKGRRVAEFALRRAQEPFVVTRSAYIGGMSSTSFVASKSTSCTRTRR